MPVNIPITIQDLAVVIAVVASAFLLWRMVRRQRTNGCSSCNLSPDSRTKPTKTARTR